MQNRADNCNLWVWRCPDLSDRKPFPPQSGGGIRRIRVGLRCAGIHNGIGIIPCGRYPAVGLQYRDLELGQCWWIYLLQVSFVLWSKRGAFAVCSVSADFSYSGKVWGNGVSPDRGGACVFIRNGCLYQPADTPEDFFMKR